MFKKLRSPLTTTIACCLRFLSEGTRSAGMLMMGCAVSSGLTGQLIFQTRVKNVLAGQELIVVRSQSSKLALSHFKGECRVPCPLGLDGHWLRL